MSLAFHSLLLCLYSSLVCGACTSNSVVTVPIRNVTLQTTGSQDNNLIRRGIALQIGTPPQALAFEAAGYANNTIVSDDTSSCPSGVAQLACVVDHGGVLFESESSTWKQAASMAAAGAAPENISSTFNYPADDWGTDVLYLSNTANITSHPIDVTKQANFAINALGLGSDSSILTSLMNAGTIASKTWSIFFGLHGADSDDQLDGSLVLGGYDEAKITGTNLTTQITQDTDCRTGYVVTVSSIDMGFRDGTSQTLSNSPLQFCVDPTFALVTMPPALLRDFQDLAGGSYLGLSSGININGLVCGVDDAFSGNLSFSLLNGPQITIPNSQLVVPDVFSDPSSGILTFNDSTRNVLVSSPQGTDPTDITYLGTPFFTAAYMMVNYPETFTLWQSKPTPDQNIVAVDASGAVCSAAQTSSPSSTPKPKSTPKSLSTGSAVAIAVGGIAVIAVSAAAFTILLCRRKRETKIAQEDGHDMPNRYHEYRKTMTKAELAADDIAYKAASRPYSSSAAYKQPSRIHASELEAS